MRADTKNAKTLHQVTNDLAGELNALDEMLATLPSQDSSVTASSGSIAKSAAHFLKALSTVASMNITAGLILSTMYRGELIPEPLRDLQNRAKKSFRIKVNIDSRYNCSIPLVKTPKDFLAAIYYLFAMMKVLQSSGAHATIVNEGYSNHEGFLDRKPRTLTALSILFVQLIQYLQQNFSELQTQKLQPQYKKIFAALPEDIKEHRITEQLKIVPRYKENQLATQFSRLSQGDQNAYFNSIRSDSRQPPSESEGINQPLNFWQIAFEAHRHDQEERFTAPLEYYELGRAESQRRKEANLNRVRNTLALAPFFDVLQDSFSLSFADSVNENTFENGRERYLSDKKSRLEKMKYDNPQLSNDEIDSYFARVTPQAHYYLGLFSKIYQALDKELKFNNTLPTLSKTIHETVAAANRLPQQCEFSTNWGLLQATINKVDYRITAIRTLKKIAQQLSQCDDSRCYQEIITAMGDADSVGDNHRKVDYQKLHRQLSFRQQQQTIEVSNRSREQVMKTALSGGVMAFGMGMGYCWLPLAVVGGIWLAQPGSPKSSPQNDDIATEKLQAYNCITTAIETETRALNGIVGKKVFEDKHFIPLPSSKINKLTPSSIRYGVFLQLTRQYVKSILQQTLYHRSSWFYFFMDYFTNCPTSKILDVLTPLAKSLECLQVKNVAGRRNFQKILNKAEKDLSGIKNIQPYMPGIQSNNTTIAAREGTKTGRRVHRLFSIFKSATSSFVNIDHRDSGSDTTVAPSA